MKAHWKAATSAALIVVLFPVGTYEITAYAKRTSRSETNARIAAVEKEATDRAAAVAKASRDADEKSCEAGNEFRANDIATWEKLGSLLPPPSAVDKPKYDQFRDFILKKDAPRNCTAFTAPKGP